MIYSLLLVAGVVLGLAVGRWWVLVFALVVAVWVGFTSEVEVDSWFLGAVDGLIAGIAIAVGVALRRSPKDSPQHPPKP